MTKPFATEAALCAAFLQTVPSDWTAYPETGWDILLVHKEGWQLGIEAKLTLNAKVLTQAYQSHHSKHNDRGPDFRAVLVGSASAEMREVAGYLGLTVLLVHPREENSWRSDANYGDAGWGDTGAAPAFYSVPGLPRFEALAKYDYWRNDSWPDFAPARRETLPDYVPRVEAGRPAPLQLTAWKIAAFRVCILVERRGGIDMAGFRALKVSPSRWTQQEHWLQKSGTRGVWVPGKRFPLTVWRAQHPEVCAAIEADFDKWAAGVPVAPQCVQPGFDL
jgi:hypothetical protein